MFSVSNKKIKRCSFGMYSFLTHGHFVSLRNFFSVSNKAMKTLNGYIEIDHMVRLFFRATWLRFRATWLRARRLSGDLTAYRKTRHKSQHRRNFGSARTLFVICTRVTTLHSCYNCALVLQLCSRITWKMHSFRPIRLEQFFSCRLIKGVV